MEQQNSTKKLPVLAYNAALKIADSARALSVAIKKVIESELPTWSLTLRIGITTGPALHGLLKSDSLTNPDVIGAAVNLMLFLFR